MLNPIKLIFLIFSRVLIIDAAVLLRQGVERLHLVLGQFEVEDVEVLFLVQLARRTRERDDTELDVPTQNDLGHGLAFLSC